MPKRVRRSICGISSLETKRRRDAQRTRREQERNQETDDERDARCHARRENARMRMRMRREQETDDERDARLHAKRIEYHARTRRRMQCFRNFHRNQRLKEERMKMAYELRDKDKMDCMDLSYENVPTETNGNGMGLTCASIGLVAVPFEQGEDCHAPEEGTSEGNDSNEMATHRDSRDDGSTGPTAALQKGMVNEETIVQIVPEKEIKEELRDEEEMVEDLLKQTDSAPEENVVHPILSVYEHDDEEPHLVKIVRTLQPIGMKGSPRKASIHSRPGCTNILNLNNRRREDEEPALLAVTCVENNPESEKCVRCLVCMAPCIPMKNRKVSSDPFCRKCRKAFCDQQSNASIGPQRWACPKGGNCVIDYRHPRQWCDACYLDKMVAATASNDYDCHSNEEMEKNRPKHQRKTRNITSNSNSGSVFDALKSTPSSVLMNTMSVDELATYGIEMETAIKEELVDYEFLAQESGKENEQLSIKDQLFIKSEKLFVENNLNSRGKDLGITIEGSQLVKKYTTAAHAMKPTIVSTMRREDSSKISNEKETIIILKRKPVKEIKPTAPAKKGRKSILREEWSSDSNLDNDGQPDIAAIKQLSVLNDQTSLENNQSSPEKVPSIPMAGTQLEAHVTNKRIIQGLSRKSLIEDYDNESTAPSSSVSIPGSNHGVCGASMPYSPPAVNKGHSTVSTERKMGSNYESPSNLGLIGVKEHINKYVHIFSCGHACSTCNSASSTKWLKETGFFMADPISPSSRPGLEFAKGKRSPSKSNGVTFNTHNHNIKKRRNCFDSGAPKIIRIPIGRSSSPTNMPTHQIPLVSSLPSKLPNMTANNTRVATTLMKQMLGSSMICECQPPTGNHVPLTQTAPAIPVAANPSTANLMAEITRVGKPGKAVSFQLQCAPTIPARAPPTSTAADPAFSTASTPTNPPIVTSQTAEVAKPGKTVSLQFTPTSLEDLLELQKNGYTMTFVTTSVPVTMVSDPVLSYSRDFESSQSTTATTPINPGTVDSCKPDGLNSSKPTNEFISSKPSNKIILSKRRGSQVHSFSQPTGVKVKANQPVELDSCQLKKDNFSKNPTAKSNDTNLVSSNNPSLFHMPKFSLISNDPEVAVSDASVHEPPKSPPPLLSQDELAAIAETLPTVLQDLLCLPLEDAGFFH